MPFSNLKSDLVAFYYLFLSLFIFLAPVKNKQTDCYIQRAPSWEKLYKGLYMPFIS